MSWSSLGEQVKERLSRQQHQHMQGPKTYGSRGVEKKWFPFEDKNNGRQSQVCAKIKTEKKHFQEISGLPRVSSLKNRGSTRHKRQMR